MIIAIVILATALAIVVFLFIMSLIACNEVIDKYAKEVVENEELEKINKNLRQQLDCRKQVLKIEQVNLQPVELHYQLQFDMHPVSNISIDMKKKLVYKRLCNELAKELEKRPDLCKINTTENYQYMYQCVDATIRVLPYID